MEEKSAKIQRAHKEVASSEKPGSVKARDERKRLLITDYELQWMGFRNWGR